ncbi:hypothetical protein H0H92_009916 [Tricholoma furcatifolium]|nr:hypothetical protein H0H92_009916 [Tricholoma furcatifolium]
MPAQRAWIRDCARSDAEPGLFMRGPLPVTFLPSFLPAKNGALWNSLNSAYSTDAFKARAIEWIAGAVKVPTESYDDLGAVGEDSRWEVLGPFHDYLLHAFPLV